MVKYFFVVILVFSCVGIYAQHSKTYSSKNTKAIRLFENARQFYDQHLDAKAVEELKKSIKEDSAFVEPYLLLANIYTDEGKKNLAKDSYRKAINIDAEFFPKALYTLADLEFTDGEYEQAKEHAEKFLLHKEMTKPLQDKAKRVMENSEFAIYAIKHPVPFNPVNLGDSINSSDNEYSPAITADGNTLIFTRQVTIHPEDRPAYTQEDFFVSHWVNGHWTKSVPINEINTEGNEGAPSLSADGQYLFFATIESKIYGYPKHREGYGKGDIYIAKKVGDKWNRIRNLGPPVNTGAWESQPSFSSDGRTLYFVRKDKEKTEFGPEDYNIYVTHLNDDGSWSNPEKLSDKINTPGTEEFVFIHPDNQTLYFSSDGHPGMGGEDIFMSKRQPSGDWGDPVNLGYPINTLGDERGLIVSPSGDVAYISSDRPGGKGGLDLYSFALYDSIKPEKVAYLKGHVIDEITKAPLVADFELIDLETGKVVISSTSNSGNGEFLVVLPCGKNYALNVSRENYLFYSEHFELKDPKNAKNPVLKDILMKPIKAGETVVLNNIFYETDAYSLKKESKVELDKLINFLKTNPKVKIEIGGHTDNVGTQQYNQTLSEKRAKTVYDYLISNGIQSTRLSYKGYGDTKPVADNTTEAGRSQNRRTEFMVVSVN